jgi:hypothetical protein
MGPLPKVIALMVASFATAAVAAPAVPARLAIYYGYPGLINGAASNIESAASVLSAYDVVVLGGGLELAEHPDHDNTVRIIERLRRGTRGPELFGYIALGPSTNLDGSAIERRAALWASTGVTGIFYDEAGRDFGVTFAQIVHAVRTARRHRLAVCLNAFDLSAINEGIREPEHGRLIGRSDALLIESFGVRLGERQTRDEIADRLRPADVLRRRTGIRLFGITTTTTERPFQASDLAFARELATEWRLDAVGWGDPDYGAANSRLGPAVQR